MFEYQTCLYDYLSVFLYKVKSKWIIKGEIGHFEGELRREKTLKK